MTDAELAALESRLAPVLAEGGRGVVDRHDVLALRAFVPLALAALEHVSWVFEGLNDLRAEEGSDERLVRKLRGHLWRARGAVLAALESRPAGVVADHEAGDLALERVMQDRAELERLRQPPDVAGLMPAADLVWMRQTAGRLANDYQPGTATAAQRLSDVRAAGNTFPALLAHADALQSLVRELYAVVADLREDLDGRGGGAYARGRAEGRDGVATWLERLSSVHEPATPHGLERVCFRCMAALALAVRKLGPCRPPLPPCEAERLLRDLLAAAGRVTVTLGPGTPDWFEPLQAAVAAARAALGEDAR